MKKKTKKTLIILGIITAIIVILGYFYFNQVTTGLQLRITDAPGDMESLLLSISQVRVNSPSGWIVVNDKPQTFDLINLNRLGLSSLIGDVALEPGRYEQIRLSIDSAIVKINGVNYLVTIPSRELKIISGFNIENGKKTILTLDFDAQNSINLNENNQGYKLRPTVKVLYENVECTQESDCGISNSNTTYSCSENKCSATPILPTV